MREPCRTLACRRRLTAYASLQLPAAPDAQRLAALLHSCGIVAGFAAKLEGCSGCCGLISMPGVIFPSAYIGPQWLRSSHTLVMAQLSVRLSRLVWNASTSWRVGQGRCRDLSS